MLKEMQDAKKIPRRACMRINKISALVLALCFVMLVSTASAYTINIPGGTGSSSAMGTSNGASGLITYGSGSISGISGINFDHILSEEIWAEAKVSAGQVGEAHSEYTTNGPKTAFDPIDAYRSLSVTLDGTVTADVTKSSTLGESYAKASMYTKAAIDDSDASHAGDIFGTSGLEAEIHSTGAGTAKATATGTTSFEAINTYEGKRNGYSMGSANGAVNLEGSNDNFGGDFYGNAHISTLTYISPTQLRDLTTGRFGQSTQEEYLDLRANRGISYDGSSYIEGGVQGVEEGETSLEALDCNRYIVDSEATSYGYGYAYAYNKNDRAASNTWLKTDAQLIKKVGGVDTSAKVDTGAIASAVRKTYNSNSPRMEATATMDIGTWTTSAMSGYQYLSIPYPASSSIAGALGVIPDGKPNGVPGMSATAWQFNKMTKIIDSKATFEQTATTAGKPHITTKFDVKNNGPKYTGTNGVNDATGAYGAVKDLSADVQFKTLKNTKIVDMVATYPDSYNEIKAIEWIGGSDPAFTHYHIDNTNVVNKESTTTYNRVSDWSFTNNVNAVKVV